MSQTLFFKIFYIILSLTVNYRRTYKQREEITSISPLKVYKIDMDLEPADRWREFINDKREGMNELFEYVSSQIPFFQFATQFSMGQFNTDREFVYELMGISDLSGISYTNLFTMNFIYELWSACTSAIIRNTNGQIIHARNLDYALQDKFAKVAGTGHFYQNGKLIYKTNIFAGSIGIFEGTRIGGFGLSIDARFGSGDVLANFLKYDFINNIPVGYQLRKTLLAHKTFKGAVEELSNIQLGGNCYLIVSGLKDNEGVILIREKEFLVEKIELSDEQWFLIATNYDRKNIMDDLKDFRRIPAELRLLAKGQNCTEQDIFDNVMSKYPNFNEQTIITTLMNSKSGYFNATVWWES